MPLLETKGAASAQGFGGAGAGASGPVTYIEDVFSTYLYTGNSSTQTITNGIDLAGKGGMIWIKPRNQAQDHIIFDTVGGITKSLTTNNTNAQYTATGVNEGLASFNSTGFTTKLYQNSTGINNSACNLASWTFREQPKFFDIVTYTGNGANRTISHNLGSVPGCIIVKCTSTTGNWVVYHRSAPSSLNGYLNTTDDFGFGPMITSPTSTQFSINTAAAVNTNGETYVAYLFAHDAGGFGLTGSDNVISCGSYTGNGSATGPTITLGYEPQWLMVKVSSSGIGSWIIYDIMRGLTADGTNDAQLYPNAADAEYNSGSTPLMGINATGFQPKTSYNPINASGETYIYIAIRRGPMKVPTSGTSVFDAGNGWGNTGLGQTFDMGMGASKSGTYGFQVVDRLRGIKKYTLYPQSPELLTYSTSAESTTSNPYPTGLATDSGGYTITAPSPTGYIFRRAPGFFDVVCYTGTGATQNVTHNLGAAPELMILKRRDGVSNWATYAAPLGNTKGFDGPNTDGAAFTSSLAWNNTTPTSSVFTVGTANSTNQNAATYVAYLFATCAGVSKVGSYTGTGALQTVNCGFTGGARFVLIKRTDSTGDWYVYDSARGISSGNDPYLLLNSTAAEVTGTNYVDTTSVGFQVTAAAPAGLNANGGTYIFLAIA